MAYGTNDRGDIVGQLLLSNDTSPGFLYSNGNYTILNDPLAVDGETRAYGINNSGVIVGNYAAENISPVAVPGPIAGAGLPGLLCIMGGLLVWSRRRVMGRFARSGIVHDLAG